MQLIIWGAVIAVSIILDQLSKFLVVRDLKPIGSAVVLEKVLGLRYVENTGAAFGMMKGYRWVFIVLSTIAILAIAFVLVKKRRQIPLTLGLWMSMIVGGGIGNQIDRLANGYVVDFFEFLFVDFAIFNVADSFVTVGAAMILIDLLFLHRDFLSEPSSAAADHISNSDTGANEP